MPDIRAVIFDMDGLLLDSEVYWARARTAFCASRDCTWRDEDELSVKGHNSPEWAAAILAHCGFSATKAEIAREVETRMRALYTEHLPLLPGAVETVIRLHGTHPLAIASSSPPELIEFAMRLANLLSCFAVIVSADRAGRGKPAPDVFLVAARRLGHDARHVAVFEDSTAGIRAARAAGMFVIAVPNPHYPPAPEVLSDADIVLHSLEEFRLDMLESKEE